MRRTELIRRIRENQRFMLFNAVYSDLAKQQRLTSA
jgi:hypothetical protein